MENQTSSLVERYVFGVDIGGTTVKIGLLDMDGHKIEVWEIPTRTEDEGKNVLPDIAEAIRNKMTERGIKDSQVVGVGAGAPGPFGDDGTIFKAVNLGWSEFNMKDELHDLVKIPVKCGNDANVAALGEYWMGGGQGYKDMLMVTLGTGVGGGIIHNGKIFNGATGAGGEIGHIHINDDETLVCGCGHKGCLEQYASATGAVLLMNRLLEESDEECVLRGTDFMCKDIFDAAKKGDKLANEAITRYGEYLGKGLAMIASTINPEIIVFGGGVSKAGDVLFDLVRPSFEKYVFPGAKRTKFALAKLGNDAGIFGAAKLVLDSVSKNEN
ncbi:MULTISPECIES: ROK family glucokinase [unclassified Butyrivibrio]|uniref:ROK family glucokinase n=1 Tax=unclassified Butyrivibrio TaxID=2639466 RepID=UPI0003B5EBF6|nr:MULTISPECIES: ROK family glucokinase [unclassified Butyrivibrio]SDB59685.1 glucokinase [Butyrivibrio sp. INlla16]